MALPPRASFLGLPAELRLSIIDYLFDGDAHTIDFYTDSFDQTLIKCPRGALALLHTSHLLRIEALPLRPAIGDVTLRLIAVTQEDVQKWVQALGISNLNKIAKLEIRVTGSCQSSKFGQCTQRLIIENNQEASTHAYQNIPWRDWMDRDTRTLLSGLSTEYARRNLRDFFCCQNGGSECIYTRLKSLFMPLGALFINGTRRPLTEEVLVEIERALVADDDTREGPAWDGRLVLDS